MKLYGVVTMDIVDSRNIPNREMLQQKLKRYFHLIYQKYYDSLVSQINFTLGDEWQLITSQPENCYDIVHDFQRLLWEDDIKFYSGIGIGELKTDIYEDTRSMDGSCFIMARDAINIAKQSSKKRTKYIYSKTNKAFLKSIMNHVPVQNHFFKTKWNIPFNEEVAVDAVDSNELISLDDIINVVIENNEILKSKLTRKQKIIYIEYMKHKSYRKIIEKNADKLNETIGGISQKLNSAEYFTIQRNHEMVKLLINLLISI